MMAVDQMFHHIWDQMFHHIWERLLTQVRFLEEPSLELE
jgi:hypothetical protein